VPAPDNLLTMHEVAPDVNNVRNKDASLIEPHTSTAQGKLLE
jgi:putative SOS response-associated peptidase YedK